jgi:HK97 family phage major capsid protein
MTQEELNQLLQNMQELTSLVKDHQASGDDRTIDYDKLGAELAKHQQQLAPAQQAEQPVRRGDEIPAPGDVAPVRRGKFAGQDPLDLFLAKRILETQHAFQPDKPGPSKALIDAVKAAEVEYSKALTSTGTGTGDEVVAQPDMAAALWTDIYAATRVAGLLVPQLMTSDPMDISLSFGDVTFRKGTQNTATTATDPTTAKSTLTTTEQVGEVDWSYTLDEDGAVAIMPNLREGLARNAAEYVDRFVLNADATNAATGNINLDDADPADDSYYLTDGQDGIRHQWIVDNTGQQVAGGGDALADADLQSVFGKLGKYYQDAQMDVVLVPDYSTYLKGFLKLTNVVTVDKMGSQATVLTGQLASYMGVPIVPSFFHPLGEADGKVSTTAGNNTLGSVSCFNRRMWRLGFRRGVSIEVDRDIQKRSYIMVASFRIAVGTRGTRSANTHTAGILNLLVS